MIEWLITLNRKCNLYKMHWQIIDKNRNIRKYLCIVSLLWFTTTLQLNVSEFCCISWFGASIPYCQHWEKRDGGGQLNGEQKKTTHCTARPFQSRRERISSSFFFFYSQHHCYIAYLEHGMINLSNRVDIPNLYGVCIMLFCCTVGRLQIAPSPRWKQSLC